MIDRGILKQVETLETIHIWNPRKIPEDEHPAELLIKDIPSCWNALFTLHAGIRIEEMSQNHNPHWVSNVAELFLLLHGSWDSQQEQLQPRSFDFGEEFQIEHSYARIKNWAHEKIVEDVAWHSNLFFGDNSPPIYRKSN